MNNKLLAKKWVYLGLFIVSLAILEYEIILTRIFSVTMWYHFAFMAISIAMFGMTVGAILVYILPEYFSTEKVKYHLAISSLLFSVSVVFSFLIHLRIAYIFGTPNRPIAWLCFIIFTYLITAIPFVFGGICTCLALTKFPKYVGKLYAVNLAGAAVGCLSLIFILKITDGPTAVFLVALLAGISALLFAAEGNYKKLVRIAIVFNLLLALFVSVNTILVHKQSSLLRLMRVKGEPERNSLYEKWNTFSRIMVFGNPDLPEKPFGWGISPAYSHNHKIRQLHMQIDGVAYTPLTAFDDNINKLEYLKYDITNLAHHIKQDSKVLVVGSGGGRDILSALAFKQKSVTGVEINEAILYAVNQKFGGFTGHLDRDPRVTFINDEARSYITRQKDSFDIIQVSLIDTWAATASGTFVLTENSLYTVEAWNTFLKHLTPNGVLTFSYWFFQDRPAEMYRLTSLANVSLRQAGIKDPRRHIVIVNNIHRDYAGNITPYGIGTILVSKKPFPKNELDVIEEAAKKMQFNIVLSPRISTDSIFELLASSQNIKEFTASFPLNISAPTDDNPFFFHMLRFRDVFNKNLQNQNPISFNIEAFFILALLLLTVTALSILCIIIPLVLKTRKPMPKQTIPLFLFFASIGIGFMLIEVSQMQRLIILLGHPAYALSVVLFILLLSSSLGSYLTDRIIASATKQPAMLALLTLLCVLWIFAGLTPYVIDTFRGSTTLLRILVAMGILFPIGFFMGMPFPLGMRMAHRYSKDIGPWLFGINGAMSVCGSVLAVMIALTLGISASFWIGSMCYAMAFLAFILAYKNA